MADKDTRPTPGQDPDADSPALHPPELAPGDVAPAADPSPRFYRDWRGAVAAAGILSLATGIWLIVSPFVLDFSAGDSKLVPMIAGAVVAFLALVRMAVWRAEWLSAVNVVVGICLFASGFWFTESPAASWNAWLLGVAVIVLALLSIDATEEGRMEDSPAAEPLSQR
jgi:peptidoglycan/LPS O-acetylase OafA/YrhL